MIPLHRNLNADERLRHYIANGKRSAIAAHRVPVI